MNNKPQSTPEQKLKQIEKRLIEIIASMGYFKGRSQKMAQITANIAIRKEVTQKQIRELTGYSLGTVSLALQSLEKQGFIQKTKNSHTKEYIYLDEGAFTDFRSKSMTNIFEYFSQLKKFLKDIQNRLEKPNLKDKKGYENIKNYLDAMNLLFSTLEQALGNFVKSKQNQRRTK
jgi:DNA-binding transcriptional regulator GbsR (MarR family)